jgi:hypothetical protein
LSISLKNTTELKNDAIRNSAVLALYLWSD